MTGPSWRDTYQAASFRGKGFFVETAKLAAGRRVVTHEYPGKNTNYKEDIGRSTREYSIDAYVLGADYQVYRDGLLEAIETEGAGELVHPYYGRLKVQVTQPASVVESSADGGMAKISFVCEEMAEQVYPKFNKDTSVSLLDAVNDAFAGVLAAFDKVFSVVRKAKKVVNGVVATINNAAVTIEQIKGHGLRSLDFTEQIAGLKNTAQAAALALDPNALANELKDVLMADLSAAGITANLKMQNYGAGDTSLEPNKAALQKLIRQLAVIGAAEASASVQFVSADDAEAMRTQLGEALYSLMMESDGEVYDSLYALRAGVMADIAQRSINLPRITKRTFSAALPALFAAYDLYEDITRADELIVRNGIMHPGMVPAGLELEVLSRV